MVSLAGSIIKVHQCIFGYDDGHRLLAGSVQLPSETSSLLLPLSDLAPGVSFSKTEGYWTGVPLPKAKVYALSRTWPAPEMSRPGCVWTHSLLISFADVARISNLNYLRSLVVRPSRSEPLDSYNVPLRVDLDCLEEKTVRQNHEDFNDSDAGRVLRAVYTQPPRGGVVEASIGALDTLVFALWSQQWPRLRRSFAFRTAGTNESPVNFGVRFDLQITASSHADTAPRRSSTLATTNPEMWETAALKDLRSTEPTDFRRFLWRYGADVRRGRERFQVLAHLYVATRVSRLEGHTLRNMLASVVELFPDKEDGKTLKEDLVSCGRSAYSLLPPSDALDTLSFFFDSQQSTTLPLPPQEVLGSLHDEWDKRSEQILTIADHASLRETPLGSAIIVRVAESMNPDRFLSLTQNYRRLRRILVCANPSLLNSKDLLGEEPTEIVDLVTLLRDNEPLIDILLSRLVIVDSTVLAEGLFTRFPESTLRAVVNALDGESEETGAAVPLSWLNLIANDRRRFLTMGCIEKVRVVRTLAVLASLLGYDHADVLPGGPRPWAEALRTAQGNLAREERQMFFAFLLAVALHAPRPGSEQLLQLTFEPVHDDLAINNFSPQAFALLAHYLPNLYFWQQWDSCLRLRTAVINAYVEHKLDPNTFPLLCKSTRLRKDLMELARQTYRGKRFLKTITLEI